MTAAPALIAPVATPMHKTMLLLSASRTVESIWPTGFLEGCLALFFGAVQLQEMRQWHPKLIRFIAMTSLLIYAYLLSLGKLVVELGA
jgi:hypothetical protein